MKRRNLKSQKLYKISHSHAKDIVTKTIQLEQIKDTCKHLLKGPFKKNVTGLGGRGVKQNSDKQ